jgi:hypothetical protein
VTANALRRFGYRPPPEAEEFVCDVMAKCDIKAWKADNSDLDDQMNKAKEAVKALTVEVCRLGPKLQERVESEIRRIARRERIKNLFTLGAHRRLYYGEFLCRKYVGVQEFTSPGSSSNLQISPKAVKDCADRATRKRKKMPEEAEEGL